MSQDRKDGGPAMEPDTKAKVEITPQMVSAGVEAVWEGLAGSEPSLAFSAPDLAIAVFEGDCALDVGPVRGRF